MKKYKYILPGVMIILTATFAQMIPPKSIEDSVLGWMKVYNFTGVKEPVKVDDKLYSAAQLSIAQSFANWIQASYIPKGGLGDVKITVSEKLGLYNQNDASLPQTYGAYAKTYTELKYDGSRKMIPATNGHLYWSIRANAVFGEPVQMLNTPTQYYFLIPYFDKATAGGRNEDEDRILKLYDLSNHPILKRYITYYNFQLRSMFASSSNVLLCKDNKLPFVKITKEEYLDKTAAAVERKYIKEKEYAIKGWPDGNARTNALRDADNRYQKRLNILKDNREKYKSRYQETAQVFTLQPDELLENHPDVFKDPGGSGDGFPVYKIDPVMAELSKKDKPQWILVSWDGNITTPVGKQQHEAIINNFNFDYVYNYFFDPEKVKGQPYKPLRSPSAEEAVVVAEASEASKNNISDKNVHFFEDFSTTGIGQKPIGWSAGTTGIVTNRDGLPGTWAVLGGYSEVLTPNQLKKPLPKNFTVSYELVAAQNFTWGAKGLTFQLANEKSAGQAESYMRLKLRPGFDGRDGEAMIETKFPSGYLSGSKWMAAVGFSNNKKNNHIRVSIKKISETMQVFIDDNKIAEYEKAIPSDLLFNAMSFFILGSSHGENDKFYISNIKISKEQGSDSK